MASSATVDLVGELRAQAEAAQANAARSRAAVGKDDFLKLLVTQLQHQDPLSPASDTEFLAQLATFSSLEQLMEANKNLLGIAIGQMDLVNAQALSLIGKEVLVGGSEEIELRNGAADRIVYALPGPVQEATLTIYGPDGSPVRTIALDPSATGRRTVDWDGTANDGTLLPDGTYRIEIRAVGFDGQPVEVGTFLALVIDGVSFDGGLFLVAGDRIVPFDKIVEIRGGF